MVSSLVLATSAGAATIFRSNKTFWVCEFTDPRKLLTLVSWNEVGVDPETSTGFNPPDASSAMLKVIAAGAPEAIEDAAFPETSEAENAGDALAFRLPTIEVNGATRVIVRTLQVVSVDCSTEVTRRLVPSKSGLSTVAQFRGSLLVSVKSFTRTLLVAGPESVSEGPLVSIVIVVEMLDVVWPSGFLADTLTFH